MHNGVKEMVKKEIYEYLKEHRSIVLRDMVSKHNQYPFSHDEFTELFPGVKVLTMEDFVNWNNAKNHDTFSSSVDNSFKAPLHAMIDDLKDLSEEEDFSKIKEGIDKIVLTHGGKRPGAGRHTVSAEEKRKPRSFKATDTEWILIAQKAKESGYSNTSEYIRALALGK